MEQQEAQYTAHAGVALFGAFVHAIEANRKGNSKTVADFMALVVMSSFSGFMFALLALQYFPGEQHLITAIAGTGGYVGIEGLGFIIAFIKKKYGSK